MDDKSRIRTVWARNLRRSCFSPRTPCDSLNLNQDGKLIFYAGFISTLQMIIVFGAVFIDICIQAKSWTSRIKKT